MDARLIVRGELMQVPAVGVDFHDLPVAILVGHGEGQLFGVEVQFQVGDQPLGRRLEEGRELGLLPQVREHGDLVLPGIDVGDLVLLPGALPRQAQELAQPFVFAPRPARIAHRHPLDQQHPVEVQQRIGQQGLALQGDDLAGLGQCGRVAPLDSPADLGQLLFVLVELREVPRTGRVLLGIGLREVLDRQPQGLEVDRPQGIGRGCRRPALLDRRRWLDRRCLVHRSAGRLGNRRAGRERERDHAYQEHEPEKTSHGISLS